MRPIVLACALAASLVGCNKKRSGDKGEAPACISAAQQLAPLFLAGAKTTHPDAKVTELELAGAVNATCTLDGWSPDAIKCFDGVKSEAELTACDKKLSKDQADKLDQAILETFAGPPPAGGAVPVAVPAEGSAGSGSGS